MQDSALPRASARFDSASGLLQFLKYICAALLAGTGLAGCYGGEPGTAGSAQPMADGSQAAPPDVPAVPTPDACSVRVSELAIYQGVKVSLALHGQASPERNAPIIAGRQALVRAFVSLPEGAPAVYARARLLVDGQARPAVVDTRSLGGSSAEGILESTFNFELTGDLLTPETRLSVELELGSSCAAAAATTFPGDGPVALGARAVGTLKVLLVPIRYDADGSGRLPDVSTEQIEIFQRTLLAIFPIADLELRVRDEVGTDIRLGGDEGWVDLLEQMRELRARDQAPADVYYYGLVAPGQSYMIYCRGACTAGLSYLAERRTALQQVGVGVGFGGSGGQTSADTLVHELGHQHGRRHAPCGQRGIGIDDGYPYDGGRVGVWGFDFRSGTLLNPATYRDIMGYCGPQWLSDYTFRALAERRASFTTAASLVAPAARQSGGYRVLLTDGAQGASWGRPLGGLEPAGRAEPAAVLDEAGREIARVTVLRTDVADGARASILVPEPLPGWAQIQVAGAAPLSFRASTRLSALRELRSDRRRP